MKDYEIKIGFTRSEIIDILYDYYGEDYYGAVDECDFDMSAWNIEDIKTAIINR